MSEDELFVAILALALLVFPLLGVARLLPWAVAALAGSALLASEHGDLGNLGLALCAALVLLAGECVSAAADLAALTTIERRLARRLVFRLAAEAVAAAALAAVVLAAASLGISTGLPTLALGLVATVSLLALVAGLVTRR